MRTFFLRLFLAVGIFLFPALSLAHEAYVLSPGQVKLATELQQFNVFEVLQNPSDLYLVILIGSCIFLVLIGNFVFRHSPWGDRARKLMEKGHVFGPLFVRLAVSAAFFASAYSSSFLAPELELENLPFALFLRVTIAVLGFCFLFGAYTEIAAIIALGIFLFGFSQYSWYMFTYVNYLGEFIVLTLFGLRVYSVDGFLFGKKKFLAEWEKYKTVVVRVFYGIGLIFTAVTVKFMHPLLTLAVVQEYKLTQYHLLFPSNPLLIVLGAGIVEVVIGLFIILGFQLRFVVLVSLFYLTLSLLFFQEQVWPHLMLYGISFSLLFDKEQLTLDNWLDKYFRFFDKKKRKR